jgi:RNase H-like domain found in reverse transcriptase
MPDVTAYTTPLSGCARNNHLFLWTLLLDKCFESIKLLVCRAPILKPINSNNPETIWVITDCSKTGVGAIYGQGSDWWTCRPAGFLSKKFSASVQHYRTHEQETIAMLKALLKWEDKLLGYKFILVTDHKGLEYFETQTNLSPGQIGWWEFLSHFDYSTLHIDGVDNKLVDCLSCYYAEDSLNESHPDYIYVNADVRLDPNGELLPTKRFVKVRAAAVIGRRLLKQKENRVLESEALDAHKESLQDDSRSSNESEYMESLSSNDDRVAL